MHCSDRKVKYLDKALLLSKELKSSTNSTVNINDCNITDNYIKDTNNDTSNSTKLTTTDGLICLEIGSYCGYSAVKIAASFNELDGSFLYCIGNYLILN